MAATKRRNRTIAVTARDRSRFSRLKVHYPDNPDHLQYDTALARELLARTAELPDTKRGLIAVLTEYRHALQALTAEEAQPSTTTKC